MPGRLGRLAAAGKQCVGSKGSTQAMGSLPADTLCAGCGQVGAGYIPDGFYPHGPRCATCLGEPFKVAFLQFALNIRNSPATHLSSMSTFPLRRTIHKALATSAEENQGMDL